MRVRIIESGIEFETGYIYQVYFKDGTSGIYYVIGLVNRSIGRTMIRVRSEDGYHGFIPVDQVLDMKSQDETPLA